MKDVEKTSVERENSSKRMRRRKRKMSLYGLIVVLLVLTVGITFSYTFLFNINEIRVAGESDEYTAADIVAASGIHEGDNLLRLNMRKSEQKILDELLYVETADVQRDFPSSLVITVSKCIPAFNVVYDGRALLVSRKGKILADNDYLKDDLPVIYGYEPSEPLAGTPLKSSNKYKIEAFESLMERLSSDAEKKIQSVDMSDEYNIVVTYSNGIIFKMGNWTDVEYKLNLAENVMEDESVKGKTGYITMIGSNQCGFRTSDAVPGGTIQQPTTQPSTNPDGTPVTTVSGSSAGTAETTTDGRTAPEIVTAAPTEAVQDDYGSDDGYGTDGGYDTGDDYGYDDGNYGYDDTDSGQQDGYYEDYNYEGGF